MKKISILLLLVAAIVGLSVFSTYVVRRDQIATRRATAEKAWTQVAAAISRRADLVPAVVASIRNTAARNRDLARNVEEARVAVTSARTPLDTITANRRLDSAMARLIAATQDDPDLLVNSRFFAQQDRWAAATNAVVPERRRYDEAVQNYNAFISDFPNTVFARWSSYRPLDNYFSADADAATESTAALLRK